MVEFRGMRCSVRINGQNRRNGELQRARVNFSLTTSVGDGSTWNNRKPSVFLVTDGAQNFQTQWNNSWSGSNSATVMDTSLCTTLKNRGIIISVL
jgi:hypothetical protein